MNEFSKTMTLEGKEWVEVALEGYRPRACIPRGAAKYAFDSIGACARFSAWEKRERGNPDDKWHFYEVRMNEPTIHPMMLVDRIYEIGDDEDDPAITPLLQEYWSPQKNWKRYEYLAGEMTIVAKLEPPDESPKQLDLLRSWGDRDLFKLSWPDLQAICEAHRNWVF